MKVVTEYGTLARGLSTFIRYRTKYIEQNRGEAIVEWARTGSEVGAEVLVASWSPRCLGEPTVLLCVIRLECLVHSASSPPLIIRAFWEVSHLHDDPIINCSNSTLENSLALKQYEELEQSIWGRLNCGKMLEVVSSMEPKICETVLHGWLCKCILIELAAASDHKVS